MKQKTTLIALLLAAAALTSFSGQGKAEIVASTVPARRTLFVSAWNTHFKIEAPAGMCFVDQTQLLQQPVWENLSASAERNHDQQLLAAFMRCDQIDTPDVWENGIPDYGIVTWLNPAIGATAKMSRAHYLDMREADFHAYAAGRFPQLTAEKTAHRTADDVSLALLGTESPQGADPGLAQPAAVIVATTTLRHVPIEFTLHYSGATAPDAATLTRIADKMAAQILLLNP